MPMIYAIVLVAGFSLMTMEMAVARVMAYYYGSKNYIFQLAVVISQCVSTKAFARHIIYGFYRF